MENSLLLAVVGPFTNFGPTEAPPQREESYDGVFDGAISRGDYSAKRTD